MRRAQRLQFGPYKQTRYRLGQKVDCERRGELTIVGTSSGRIPWAVGFGPGGNSLVLHGDLVRAVKVETLAAICYWWGVTKVTAWHWRKTLKVPAVNAGILKVKQDLIRKHGAKIRAAIDYSDPERREKIRAKALGRKHSAKTKAKMRARKLGVKLSEARRIKMSETAKRLGRRLPLSHPMWSDADDKLCRTLPPASVAARTGRTIKAVYDRRWVLGMHDGRTKRQRAATVERSATCR